MLEVHAALHQGNGTLSTKVHSTYGCVFEGTFFLACKGTNRSTSSTNPQAASKYVSHVSIIGIKQANVHHLVTTQCNKYSESNCGDAHAGANKIKRISIASPV